jgi:flagellar basal-body rod modification protein FlgD
MIANNVGNIIPYSSSDKTPKSSKSALNGLGKDAFMKLLMTQMQYQDPMSPMDNKDFIAQMAQFSSLEQMQNMNQSLTSFIKAQTGSAKLNALTLIGKDVKVNKQYFSIKNGSTEDKLKYEVQAPGDVNINIYDENGKTVRTIKLGETDPGEKDFYWDGKDDNGKTVSDGKYYLEISDKLKNGNIAYLTPSIYGKVSSISFKNNDVSVYVGKDKYSIDDILEVN